MTDIVMESGKQGSGKSSLAKAILEQAKKLGYQYFGTMKFAETLYEMHDFILNKISSYETQHGHELLRKNMAQILHNYIFNKFESLGAVGPKSDQDVLEFMQEYVELKIGSNKIHDTKKDGTLLQYLGTEVGRNLFGENVWVDIVIKKVKALESNDSKRLIVIDDCRFPNEFTSFPDALRIRLECEESVRKMRADSWRENTNHPSEIGLDEVAALGLFDLTFNTEVNSTDHCRELVYAQLQKQNWISKR